MKEDTKWFKNTSLLHPEDRDKGLYRIIPFDSLLQMLNEKKNLLVKTVKWEDVYENFILKENFIVKGKTYSVESMTEQWYGQCWSTKSSSDALWRIYSPDKRSVRIKTTIGRLWDSTKSYEGKGKFLIGSVQYVSQKQIQQDIEAVSPIKLKDLGNLIVSSFFVKRSSFSHESEFRLIYNNKEESDIQGKEIIEIAIDPSDFILNVYFDPRADNAYVDRCKKILVKSFGYPSDRIRKSSLYEFKPIRIEVKQ